MKKNEEKKTVTKTATSVKKAAPTVAAKATAKKNVTAAKNAKSAVKKSAPAVKKPGRKPKPITIDTICGLLEKKIVKAKAANINETIAVDIEVWGFEDGSNHKMYIEVMGGKANVMPHSYDAKNFRISLSFTNAMDFVNGKITLTDLLESKDFYAEGNIVSAIKLASIF